MSMYESNQLTSISSLNNGIQYQWGRLNDRTVGELTCKPAIRDRYLIFCSASKCPSVWTRERDLCSQPVQIFLWMCHASCGLGFAWTGRNWKQLWSRPMYNSNYSALGTKVCPVIISGKWQCTGNGWWWDHRCNDHSLFPRCSWDSAVHADKTPDDFSLLPYKKVSWLCFTSPIAQFKWKENKRQLQSDWR